MTDKVYLREKTPPILVYHVHTGEYIVKLTDLVTIDILCCSVSFNPTDCLISGIIISLVEKD